MFPVEETLDQAMIIPVVRFAAGEILTAPVVATLATTVTTSSSPLAGTDPTSIVAVAFIIAEFTVPTLPNLNEPFASSVAEGTVVLIPVLPFFKMVNLVEKPPAAIETELSALKLMPLLTFVNSVPDNMDALVVEGFIN